MAPSYARVTSSERGWFREGKIGHPTGRVPRRQRQPNRIARPGHRRPHDVRLILRVGPDAGGTRTTVETFAHAGDQVLFTFGLTGQLRERYLYGPGVDQLLAVSRIGQAIPVVWALADHQNTVRDLVDNTGAIRRHFAYDSFGNVVSSTGEEALAGFNVLYTGREFDAATGLYFYRARWYDPAVGRFISRDPQGLGDGPNPFAYVQNHAVSATDPSGELAWFVLPLIFGGIGAAHAGSMARARGDSWWWTGGQAALGAVSGVFNPWATTLGAAGAVGGAVIGYGTDGWRGAYYGAEVGGLVGLLGGGFVDAYRLRTAFGPLPACAVTRPYLLPSMQLGGAGVGGYLGYRATGTLDGALAGANVGMLLGGIGATTYNLLRPCFAAGTPIRTAEGSKPIEEIVAGDYVLSRDENDPDGPVLLKVVEETFVRTGRIWVLRIDGRDIRTTGEHPFYARGKGWTAVAELATTDELMGEDGRWLPIEALKDTGEYETVYNFRVADFHTYFIGGDGWTWSVWTHNAACADIATFRKAYASRIDGMIHELEHAAERKLGESEIETITQRLWLWYNKGARGKLPAIGAHPDPRTFTGGKSTTRHCQIFILGDLLWNRQINEMWLRGAMDARRKIRILSDPSIKTNITKLNGEQRIFGWEMDYLTAAGYTQSPAGYSQAGRNYMIPPKLR